VIFGILIWIEHKVPKRPNGFILAATMALWGLSRFAEEHLWLSDTSHLGDLLVQIAGLALCAAGVVTMFFLWRRQRRALEAEASDPDNGPSSLKSDAAESSRATETEDPTLSASELS
jgi:prolipoprotein diacylglyceryltransferase